MAEPCQFCSAQEEEIASPEMTGTPVLRVKRGDRRAGRVKGSTGHDDLLRDRQTEILLTRLSLCRVTAAVGTVAHPCNPRWSGTEARGSQI